MSAQAEIQSLGSLALARCYEGRSDEQIANELNGMLPMRATRLTAEDAHELYQAEFRRQRAN